MADESTGLSGQEPTAPTGGQEPTTDTLNAADALEALKAARREAAQYRTRLSALEKVQQEAEAAKLSDLEKATKRAAELEAENKRIVGETQAALTTARIERLAVQLGAVDPELVALLIRQSDIERDDAGQPTNLEALVKGVLKAKPFLTAPTAPPQAGATNPARNHATGRMTLADVKSLTRHQIAAMTPEERADVQRALSGR